MSIAALIDHTLLAPDVTAQHIRTLCREAVDHGFATVCVSPTRVRLAADELAGHAPRVCSVIGFPSGTHLSEIKAAETKAAVNDGADEIDMVINVGAVKDDDWDTVESDISAVVDAAGMAIVKVILEVSELTDEEITRACQAAERCGADFVKTSTGYSRHGATAEAVSLMRRTVGDRLGVKASGGIRTHNDVATMLRAGATRIGASAGVALLVDEEAL